MQALFALYQAHPWFFHAFASVSGFFLTASMLRWPPPKDPRWRPLWAFWVRLLVREWNEYGGAWKLPGFPSTQIPPDFGELPAERRTTPLPPTPKNTGQ